MVSINDYWNFTCVIFPQHIVNVVVNMINILSVWLSNQSWLCKGKGGMWGMATIFFSPLLPYSDPSQVTDSPPYLLPSCSPKWKYNIYTTQLHCVLQLMCAVQASLKHGTRTFHTEITDWSPGMELFLRQLRTRVKRKMATIPKFTKKCHSGNMAQGCYLTGGKKMNIWVSRVTVPNCFKPHHDP